MIRSFTAYTEEIDDASAAVAEILAQLGLEGRLLAHSLGIIQCYNAFIEEGVAAAISDALPFTTVGCSALSVSSSAGRGQIALTVMVLTSDDVEFATAVSGRVDSYEKVGPAVADAYHEAAQALSQEPLLLIPFVPFIFDIGGDEWVEQLDAVSGRLPAFGALSFSDDTSFTRIYTFKDGTHYEDAMVLVALTGDVHPSFFQISVFEESIAKTKAVVTASSRSLLQGINAVSPIEFFKSMGFENDKDDKRDITMLSLVIDLEDGSRLIRTCLGENPDGSLLLSGKVPVGGALSFAVMSPDDVVAGAKVLAQKILPGVEGRGMLAYSCAARSWALGINDMAEHEQFQAVFGNTANYLVMYAGGEIFPSFRDDGSVVANHLQNDSLIVCVF